MRLGRGADGGGGGVEGVRVRVAVGIKGAGEEFAGAAGEFILSPCVEPCNRGLDGGVAGARREGAEGKGEAAGERGTLAWRAGDPGGEDGVDVLRGARD